MKKVLKIFLPIIFSVSFIMQAFAISDELIYKDKVDNIYYGSDYGKTMISNLSFNDITKNHPEIESITRVGALDIIKGYGKEFKPDDIVSNQEAISFVVRMLGLEKDALESAKTFQDQRSDLKGLWSLGYLLIARDLGIISEQDFLDSTVLDQNVLDSNTSFIRTRPATKENIADFITKGLNSKGETLKPNSSIQNIYKFKDFENINVNKIASVEAVLANNIMVGESNDSFSPKKSVNRSEMARILRNIDSVYYKFKGIERKNGTVGAVNDEQTSANNNHNLIRNIYVRATNGLVDIFKLEMNSNSSPQAKNTDAVVLKDGIVQGLSSLSPNDKIEYLVDTKSKSIIYIYVIDSVLNEAEVEGKLQHVDFEKGTIKISGTNDKTYTYTMADGIYETKDSINYLIVDNRALDYKKMMQGTRVKLYLLNDNVQSIKYIGDPVVINETRGIVIQNDPAFGILTFIDNNGQIVTKNYYGNIKVEKQTHYNLSDDIGYFDEIFPDFRYDPRDTTIDAIEPGDIIFVRPSEDDPTYISSLSAATNYILKHGKVLNFVANDEYYDLTVEYEDKQTAFFEVASDIFVSLDGSPKSTSDIQIGDYLKLLVNQAIISPGYIMESVKEITIEGNDHFIATIGKAKLSAIDFIQQKLKLKDYQELTLNGWGKYKNIGNINLNDKEIEIYHNDKRITLDYAKNYLKRTEGDVYIAIENNYAGNQIKKITFRDGRDTLFDYDSVINTKEDGSFKIISWDEDIKTDVGSIIVKNGRLVNNNALSASDYARVSLNNGSLAAVVDIVESPGYESVFIARGRVNSANEGKSFRVQSIAHLTDANWIYSPVNRDFSIDFNTMYLNKDGLVSLDKFLDYTEDSIIDKVFNVVVDGTKATHIVDSPYAKEAVRGTIYSIDKDTVKLKDVSYFNKTSKTWTSLSNKDNSCIMTIPLNSTIAKNNKVVNIKDLEIGNKLEIMTDTLPEKMTTGITINGYIVLVIK